MEQETEYLITRSGGLTLEQLETIIKDTMALSSAEVRFDARKEPVKLRINYNAYVFTISKMSIDKKGLIMDLDVEF